MASTDKMTAVIETWARRECRLSGIDPDADWRCANGVMLDVAVPDADKPNWRHHFGKKAERLLEKLKDAGYRISLAGDDDS